MNKKRTLRTDSVSAGAPPRAIVGGVTRQTLRLAVVLLEIPRLAARHVRRTCRKRDF